MANKLAIVTGASTGIGFELATIAAREGYDLIVAADEPLIEAAAKDFAQFGTSVEPIEVDLSTIEGVDRMLAAAGLTDKVFITNTVFWRPPGNRTPSPQEQAACAPFVERTFALLKPKAVLLLGAAAARSVLQTEDGIMKMRGQWREWRLNEGAVAAPAMPTLHPAFLLRQPQAKRQVWADLLTLAVRLEGESHLSAGIEGKR